MFRLVMTVVLLLTGSAALGAQAPARPTSEECFGFTFGAWDPPLRSVPSGADAATPVSTPGADDAAGAISQGRVDTLRGLVQRCLDGDENLLDDVSQLAASIADSARAKGHKPERLLIGVRGLWRELRLSQADRLQVTSAVYDALVRHCIERYYGEDAASDDRVSGPQQPDATAD